VPSDSAPITKVTGLVTDSNDKPVSGAQVYVRGRGSRTDKDGNFSINGVRAKNNDDLRVEVLYLTPAGVALKAGKTVKAVVPGTTDAGTIKLPAEPQLTLLIRPTEVKINVGETANMKVVLSKALSSAATINLAKADGVELVITPTSLMIDAGQTEASFTVMGNQAGKAYITARLAATVGQLTPEQTRAGYAVVYVRLAAPTLSSISPDHVAPGTTFTLTGTGFDSDARHNGVFFKQGDYVVQLDPDKLKLTSATTIQGTVPGLKAGAAEVYVVIYQEGVLSAPSNHLALTVTAPSAPVLSSISPSEGLPKSTFTITGTGFNAEARRNGIYFKQGDRLAAVDPDSVKLTSATMLQGTVPALPSGAAEVFVVTSQETAPTAPSNRLSFTVKALPAPVLSRITPNHGAPGEAFTLTGTGFNPEARFNYVLFKQGDHTEYLSGSSMKVTTTTIEGTVPRLSPGAVEVYVIVGGEGVPAGQSNHLAFTVNAPPPPPTPVLSNITPSEGTPGTSFTITGTGFKSSTAVFFKQGDHVVQVSAQLSTANSSAMTLSGAVPDLPAGAAEVYVVTSGDGATNATSNHLAFTVKAKPAPPAPVLSSITPNEGLPGASFSLAGTGFGTYNVVFFKQGDHVVPVSTKPSTASNATTLTGAVPDLPAGAAEVYVVIYQDGVLSAQSNHLAFTVKARPAPSAPVLSGITPNEGTPGTTFAITGTGFGSYNVVFFKQGDRIVSVNAQLSTANSTMTLTGAVPDLPAGAAEVYAVTAQNSVPSAPSNHLAFTVKAKPTPSAPVLSGITPSEGAPGATFTIRGTGFGSSNGVYFKQGDHVVGVSPTISTANGVVTLSGVVPDLPAGAAEVYVVTAREGVASAQSNHLAFTVKAKTVQ
jgi:phosphotransferase system IIA component